MLNLYIRPVASDDIDEIVDYLAESSIPAAQGFVKDLQQCFVLLTENPKIGIKREYHSAALSGMKMFPLKKLSTYLVFYLSDDQTIDIIRVLHGQRDIERLFNNSFQEPRS
ncbi:type II toxin-antitoxin system RelE/ParE family toxin [Leucothrix arctica]|uniref:Plasmid stabilization protein n=1 Tax=Leucothrix arctica TaxID=1481894 RepID=A0A317C887_9GAMM|nr:type II toxin-antitoxin system RelE/ParE family toxin [Leucothrix arctica]PWQ94875.1 plasmid stabilization protein [Leucothrix arctica]